MSNDLLNRAINAFHAGDLAEARKLCAAAARQDGRNTVALHLGAVIEAQQGNTDKALKLFDRALKINPAAGDILADKGKVLSEAGRFEDALLCYSRVLSINPGHWLALHNQASTLYALRRPGEALDAFDRLVANGQRSPAVFGSRGLVLVALNRFEDAVESYREALKLDPGDVGWLSNLGDTLVRLKRYDEARDAWGKALALQPDLPGARGAWLLAKMRIADWRAFATESADLVASVKAGKANTAPFAFLAISCSPADQLTCAATWIRDEYPPATPPLWRGQRYRHDRIRVAYLSADFGSHATSHLIAGMFEHHDRSRFDVAAISLARRDDPSGLRERLGASVERFIDAHAMGDAELADRLRGWEIDIAVDLNGHTLGARTGVLARRPAPIQLNYLGFPGTMGAGYVDYIMADRTVIPEPDRAHYSEKVIYLPHSYQVNDDKRAISDKIFSRAELGLPTAGFVFCCFNNSFKITPPVFDCWMRVLHRVEGSVLWLLEDNAAASGNLKKEAAARGIDPQRLVFAGRMDLAEHLARHRAADLFLDTAPYNAHTTASDALWAGLPVLTRIGEAFPGRVAASLLHATGMSELVAPDVQAYEQAAIDLAANPGMLTAIRQKLADSRLTAPLFDTKRFTRYVETAYAKIQERRHANLPPDHIVVPE